MAAPPEQLISFVRDCLAQGLSRSDVSRELAAAGWSPREVSLALDAFAESSLPVPVPRKRVSSSPRDAFLHLVALVALYNAAFAVGGILFVLLESPWQARRLRLDADRVGDLETIQSSIESFHERRGVLPPSLEALRDDPGTFVGDLQDPATGTAYGYRPVDADTYELSAVFDLPSPPAEEQLPWMRDRFFSHGAGPASFSVTVPKRPAREQSPAE